MPLMPFTVESIATIDGGRIKTAIEMEIRRLQNDCADRPSVEKARVVTLQIEISPVLNLETGNFESCDVRFVIVGVTPKRISKPYNMKVSGQRLLFNELSPRDVDQMTFEDAQDESGAPIRSIEEGRRTASAR